MAQNAPEIGVHKEWLGQIQPVGLVVSAYVLARYDVAIDRRLSVERQTRLKELIAEEETGRVDDFLALTRNLLEWPEGLLAGAPGGPPLPDGLTIALPEHEDHLAPTYAVPAAEEIAVVQAFRPAVSGGPEGPHYINAFLALVSIVVAGTDLDKAPSPDHKHDGWRASPHARVERLLRETRVPIGLLFNGTSLRLVYAPHGESSGHLTFHFAHLAETLGRPMVGALVALLDVGRVTDLQDEPHRLPALLRRSRESQNEVSTKLASQVLEALWDLVRGFQRANDDAKGVLLAEVLREEPHEVYGGLLSTLMRLVFVLYAEDRGLMPKGDVYQKHYAVSGLFNRLREDQARYPDTMDARYGSWAQLLALFRLIHDGGGHGDLRFPARHGRLFDPDAYARRLVAARCLYGVDKNIFAVDLAKLSLWLATLAREHPFTFLDHALRHGDSLVGLSREQIACFNWETTKQMPLLRTLIDERVAEAQALRQQIQSLATSDDVPEKARLLRDANDALHDVRLIGDLVVSAFFERDKPRDRQTLRAAYAGQVERWLVQRDGGTAGSNVAQGFSPALTVPAVVTFHWEIEFPEVFTRSNGGFDAFVGNPPFAGKNTITASHGAGYVQWLLQLHEDSHGNADLVAHFYRRAFDLLRNGGAFGLIATSTIAQGDTRSTGLRWIRQHDGIIFAARKRIKWPGEAAVVVSVVHVHKGPLAGPFDLDDRPVSGITAFLFHTGSDEDPKSLAENGGKGFIGSYVLGMGFTFDDTDKKGVANPIPLMDELIRKDPRNGERIFPYIGGDEVNDSPTHLHQRYVINFAQMSEGEALHWPDLMAIVEARVKGTRASHSTAEWWHFERFRSELYDAIRGLDRALVTCRHQPQWGLTFMPTGAVFADSLVVIASDVQGLFTLTQSRPHEAWARFLGSSMKDDLGYTPSDCFETFPFPERWESNEGLERTGREYYDFRAALMVRNSEGLTKTYNRFHDPDERDPDILKLRDLHAAMDRAVLDAYNWTDIQRRCEFILDYEDEDDDTPGQPSRRKKPWRYRWPDEIRDEVLGRLLELNTQRAKEEAVGGLAAPMEGGRAKKTKAMRAGTPLLD